MVLSLLCCLGIANLNCDVGPMLHILPRTTKNENGNRIEVGSQFKLNRQHWQGNEKYLESTRYKPGTMEYQQ